MAKFSILGRIRSQLARLPPIHRADLTGQTVVVTGSNVGLGLETAKHFARMNPANLILAVRNQSKGDGALAEIRKETGYAGGKIMLVDMGDFASVSSFATTFEKEHDRLDVLVCNAGISVFKYAATKDGWESTLQVNHLSTALVSLLLLPRLVQTAQKHGTNPRLTLVSSETHLAVNVKPALLQSPEILSKLSDREYCNTGVMLERYGLSKLLNVYFARSLTSHLPATSPVVVTSVNPGFCHHSALMRDVPYALYIFTMLMGLAIGRKTSEGAKTMVWSALAGHDDPVVRENLRGAYTENCELAEPSDFVLSKEGQEMENRIWGETLQILEKVDPRVGDVVKQYLKA